MKKQMLLTIVLIAGASKICTPECNSSYDKNPAIDNDLNSNGYKISQPDTGCLLTVTITGTSPICQGSSTQLTAIPASGVSPFTFSWSPTAGLSNPAISNPIASPASTTTYQVTVSDAAGCFTYADS
ncbi:MAG: hypothetical protein ABI855_04045 [Bacteroidota bacterium]